ncbi:putative RNA helicase [Helianthus annuus]|nr:putative RNA helicase [Helianthus annuus]
MVLTLKVNLLQGHLIWCMEGSLETWSWSLNVPVLSSLSEDNEVINNNHCYLFSFICFEDYDIYKTTSSQYIMMEHGRYRLSV